LSSGVPDPGDGRSVLVRLTDQGRRVVDAALPAYLDMQRELLACLGKEQYSQLVALLRTLLQQLEGPAEPERSSRRTAAAENPPTPRARRTPS
jgi:hypothetical protein